MKLLRRYLKEELPLMQRNNVRLSFIGRHQLLPQEVQERMAWAKEETSRNTGMVMTLALNYGSRSELVDAFKSIVHAAANNGGLGHLQIDEETINKHLYTHNLPELDLLIRTSGEMRLSNFLLWQAAYAEIYVTKTFWPDFRGTHLLEAIQEFQKRERRYGGLIEPHGAAAQYMKRVLTAAVLIPVVRTLLFKAPNWLYSGVIGVFGVIAIVEYFGIAKNYQPYHFGYVIVVAVGLYFLGHSLHDVVAFGVSDFGNRFESLVLDLSGFRVLPLLLLLLGLLFKHFRQPLPPPAIPYFVFPS